MVNKPLLIMFIVLIVSCGAVFSGNCTGAACDIIVAVGISNVVPSIDQVIINTSNNYNYSSLDITSHIVNASDDNGDVLTYIYNWYRNGSSIALLNLPFEKVNGSDVDNAHDYSGFGNGAVEVGSVTWNAAQGFDGFGAYYFDGSGDYLRVSSDTIFDQDSDFSVSVWIKPGSTAPGTRNVIVSKRFTDGGSDTTAGWHLFQEASTGLIRFGFIGYSNIDSSSALSSTNWHYLTATYDAGTNAAKLYIDGVENVSGAMSYDTNTVSIVVGNLNGNFGDNDFTGYIDELIVYNRTLTATQVAAKYQNLSNLIVSQETSVGDNWSACVTPNDGSDDGAEICSESLIVVADILSVTLIKPENNNNTVELQDELVFNCSASASGNFKNITLYHDMSGTFVVESTKVTSSAQWILNLSSYVGLNTIKDTRITWNCYVCDDEECGWADTNASFSGWDLGNSVMLEYGVNNFTLTQDELLRGFPNDGDINLLNMSGNVVLLHMNQNVTGPANISDTSGLNQRVTISNGMSCDQDGYFNYSCAFSGTVSVAANESLNLQGGSFTLSAWVYRFDAGTYDGNIFAQDSVGGTEDILVYDHNNNNCPSSDEWYSDLGGQTCFGVISPSNTWRHIVLRVTDNGGNDNVSFFVNGTEVYSYDAGDLSSNDDQNWYLGLDPSNLWVQFYGRLDEVAFWNRSLSNTEINDIFEFQSGDYPTAGEYVSKIFDAGQQASWKNITIDMPQPYGQGYPSNEESDASANMSGSIFLMHFDNESVYGENNTHFYDFSGNGNNGTAVNFSGNEFGDGKLGKAFIADGASKYINISGAVDDINTTTGSYSVWIKTDASNEDGNDHEIISVGHTENNDNQISLQIGNGVDVRIVYQGSDSSSNSQTSNLDGFIDEWKFVVATWDSTDLYLYIDGQQIDSDDKTASGIIDISLMNQASIGTDSALSANEYFHGSIDEVAIWNRTLGSAEIRDLYQRGAVRLELSARSCDDVACSGESYESIGYHDDRGYLSEFNVSKYFQYKIKLVTENNSITPAFDTHSVTIKYDVADAPNITTVYPNSTGGESYESTETINVSLIEPNNQTFNITYTSNSDVLIRWYIDSIEKTSYENLTVFNWTGNYTQEGSYLILVNVSDDNGFSYQYWNLTVNNTDVDDPVVTLVRPINNSIDINDKSILTNFTCNATNLDLKNITLWHNLNGSWVEHGTNSITGTADESSWNINTTSFLDDNTFKDSSYQWNCYACDTSDNCAFATDNETFSGWDLGTYDNVSLNSSSTEIKLTANSSGQYPNSTGYYISKVFNATFVASWNNISWDEQLPYGEELPANGMNEEASVTGGINMSGNIFYMRFNNDSSVGENYAGDDSVVYDYSPSEYNGTTKGSVDANFVPSKLNHAFNFDGVDDYIEIPHDSGQNVGQNPGDKYSLAAWIKLSDTTTTNVIISKSRPNDEIDDMPYIFQVKGSNKKLRLWRWNEGPDIAEQVNSNKLIDDTEWHHVAFVNNDASSHMLFIDGQLDIEDTTTWTQTLTANLEVLQVGRYKNGGFQTTHMNGTIDEVAIWNRSLSDYEILNIYKRGALRLNLTSRACNDAVCDGESFSGNYKNSTLSEISSQTGQYFQYRVNFETNDANLTPELLTESVIIGYSEYFLPVIVDVPSILAVDLIAGTTKAVYVVFNVSDADNASDINTSSASVLLSKAFETYRTNDVDCDDSISGEDWKYFNCTVHMYYYDGVGVWNINVSVSDMGGEVAENTTTNLIVNSLDSISLSVATIDFGSTTPLTNDVSGTVEVINNTGNNIYSQIELTGYNLTTLSGNIPSSNFCGNDINDANTGCDSFSEGSAITITGASLTKGASATESIYSFVDLPPALSVGQYSATSDWIFTVS